MLPAMPRNRRQHRQDSRYSFRLQHARLRAALRAVGRSAEERIARICARARAASWKSLEAFVHKELAALEARLNSSATSGRRATRVWRADLSATSASIFKKIGEIENHEAQAKREIRNDLLQQSKELTDAIRNKGEELIALLERRAQELQHAKTDRAALAGLFNEVALRLTDQFKVTGAD